VARSDLIVNEQHIFRRDVGLPPKEVCPALHAEHVIVGIDDAVPDNNVSARIDVDAVSIRCIWVLIDPNACSDDGVKGVQGAVWVVMREREERERGGGGRPD
jgi:hypothetical protein